MRNDLRLGLLLLLGACQREAPAAAPVAEWEWSCPPGTKAVTEQTDDPSIFVVSCTDGEGKFVPLTRDETRYGPSPAPREGTGEEDRRDDPKPAAPTPGEKTAGAAVADDPRVVCPPGTRQRRNAAFGMTSVWCVDANERRHGPSRGWWPNGNPSDEETYVHGDLEGLVRKWHDNGQLAYEATKLVGVSEGRVRLWHPNGRLQREFVARGGEPVGTVREWDERGRPISPGRE